MKNFSFAIFLFLLIVVLRADQTTVCPQNGNRDLIQTGIIEFSNTNQRQSCKDIQISYQVAYQGANSQLQIAASVIKTQNYAILKGIDYAIKVGNQANNKFTAILLSDFNANWTKITVAYIVTSRPDLLMGTFLVDSPQTLKCLQDQSNVKNLLQVSQVVKNWNNDFLAAKAIVFISGIKTISSKIDSIKVSSVELNSSGILNVGIQSSHGLQIQLIQLTYILVGASFPFQHGYQLNHPEYLLQVFEQFNNNQLVQANWGIYTGSLICQGAQCLNKCLSKDQCTGLSGNQLNGHCFLCQKGSSFNGQKCVQNCGSNQFWNGTVCLCQPKAIKQNSTCVLCPLNSTPDRNQQFCICNDGFIWNNWKSSCVSYSCPVNSEPKVSQLGVDCVCKLGFYKQGNACKLIPDCPLNSAFNASSFKCICSIEGQFMGNGVCLSCGKNQFWDDSIKKCLCKPNYILVSGSCVACPNFSTLSLDKSKCLCNEGYIWSDWKVACIPYTCPLNSIPVISQSGVKCNCKDGFYLNGQNCDQVPKCPAGALFDPTKRSCLCQKQNSYVINGQCSQCPANSSWNGNQCACNQGFVLLNTACIYVCGKNEVVQNGKCICNSKSVLVNSVCQQCPLNSLPNKVKSLCICSEGFSWNQALKSCSKVVCPENSTAQIINGATNCVCNDGFILQNSVCVKVGKCPINSVWSQDKLCCLCSNLGQYMINNQCKTCGNNEEWNEINRKCVCKKGFNLIGTQCKACQDGQTFNGKTCECNFGSYRNGLKCEACFSTCGTCCGANSNQCLTCSDVTYNFKNGSCVKDTPCPKGLYQKGSSCSPCSTYCSDCTSDSNCNLCIEGFQKESITYGGVSASYCVQKCGDGKRFQLDCDDGNNKNGDGCSSDCKVQSGWSCSGGSSSSPSFCTKGTPEKTYLQLTGTVHLYGRIVQGARLSYIPDNLTLNDCGQCYNLLWVRVIKSDIVPGVRVNYLPKTKYQFLIQFQFNGAFSIPTFNIAIQINPDYAKYFSKKDMAQIQIKIVDPSVLAMKDVEQSLSLSDITVQKPQINISNSLVKQIFS